MTDGRKNNSGRIKGSKNKNKEFQVFPNGKLGIEVGGPAGKAVILPEEVFELGLMGCSIPDMAKYFGVETSTFNNNFKPLVDRAREETKQRLRQVQLEVALEDKNTQMLIFLGKNMLGQTDAKSIDVTATATATTPQEIEDKLQRLNALLLSDEIDSSDDDEDNGDHTE